MKNKKIYLGMALLAGIILLISSASAFAVSSRYWKDSPVVVYPGQTSEIYVVLQNMGGEGDLNVRGIIVEGSEIASLVNDKTFLHSPSNIVPAANLPYALS